MPSRTLCLPVLQAEPRQQLSRRPACLVVLQLLKCSTPGLCVAGATGGVGKRVVQRLLAQGRVVRALVRDVDKAKELLVSKKDSC